MGFFSKIKDGLKKTRDSMSESVDTLLHSFTKIDDEFFDELEEILICSDTGPIAAQKICDELRNRMKSKKIKEKSEIKEEIKKVINDILSGDECLNISTKPSVILVIGVNGVGKTTSIGKLASILKKQGKKVILGAADTFRAAAIDQIEIWAKRAGVDLVKQEEGSDPAAVVFDTISAAKSRNCDVVICDTAGRLHNKKNLMDELSKINRIIKRELPESDVEVLLVLDATTGQNAVNQAKEFKKVTDITGIILTKLDGTAKGGVVISIKQELNIPVKFIGLGEQIDDLQVFDADSFSKALFKED